MRVRVPYIGRKRGLFLRKRKEDCFYEKAPILFGERAYAFGGKGVCFLEKGRNKSVS